MQQERVSFILMKPAVNITKITPPRLPIILYRSRLIDCLEKNKDKRLIFILGQAAQGKSTLAGSYVNTSDIPSAWINLGKEDSDPVNLFYSIAHALQHVLKDIDFSPLLSYPSINIGPRLEIPLYREWTNAIFEHISSPIQIVLDGLDSLSPDAPSFQLLQVLIEDAPQLMNIIMLSRIEPPFQIEGLKVKQEAYVLTNDDLAFTPDEIKAYFLEIRGISFASAQLKRVHKFTEGWIGGLILLSETLDRLPEDKQDQYLLEGIPDRFKGTVFRYFGEEILSSQPGPIQDFLIKSSIFNIVEPEFIKDFLGMEDTSAVLHEHVRKNLFVQSSYDEKKGWVFRYHQSFRDFLQTNFKSETGKEEKRTLFVKAGAVYEQRGELEDALKYYLEARAYDKAAYIIEQIGMNLVQMGRTADLALWLQIFPKNLVQENPWLLFYLSMTRRYTAADRNIGSLKRALILFEKREDTKGSTLSLAFLIEATLIKGRDKIPLNSLLSRAETLLNTLGPDLFAFEKALLLIQVGFGYILRGGNPRKGLWACENAYLISKNLEIAFLQINALIQMVMAHTFVGEYTLADDKNDELNKILAKGSFSEFRSLQLIQSCQLCIWRGAFERAEETIREAKKEIKEYGLTYLYPVTLLYDLALRICLEEHETGVMVGSRLLELSTALDNLFLQGAATFLLGALYYRNRKYKKAKVLVQDAVRILSSHEARSDEHLNEAKVLMGYIAYHLQTVESQEKELTEALKYFSETKNFFSLADANFAMALLKWKESNINETIRYLETGFQIAKEKKFDSFIMSSRKDLIKICVLAIELQVKEAMDYAAHLLSTRLASEAGPELEKLFHHSNIKISKKAREILITVHRSKLPRLRIKTLGGFEIFRGDTSMDENEWKRSQPKELLKSILSRGGKKIPKDLLMEDLWSEGEKEATERKFKVILHRLRKSLEPDMDKNFKSSYIHLKDNLVSLDNELCRVDVDYFSSLIEKGKIKEKEGDLKTAISLYTKAVDKYRGNFLSKDIYARWAELKREELKKTYISILLKLARLHEDSKAVRKAISFYKKAIQADSVLETAYQRLMTLYSEQGKQNKVLEVYKTCKKALQDELDTKPDQVTISLYKKISG
ncbi:MAG: BTAD domain-containing putative transcriptional regulator [Thermodesulfobacteriota bacterium]|nr:BTAD domain-containing putative transcriptional regulator [Thermodesulfobacteriota bacterium]